MRSSAVDEADLENSRGDQCRDDRPGAAAPTKHHSRPCLRIPIWCLLVQILAEAENVGVAAFEAAIGGHHNGAHRADAAVGPTNPAPHPARNPSLRGPYGPTAKPRRAPAAPRPPPPPPRTP